MKITLNFSIESITYLLTLLAKLPIADAHEIYTEIKTAAESQILQAQQQQAKLPEIFEVEK